MFSYGYRYKCDNTGCLNEEFNPYDYDGYIRNEFTPFKMLPTGWKMVHEGGKSELEPLTFCSNICTAAFYSGEKITQEKDPFKEEYGAMKNPDLDKYKVRMQEEARQELNQREEYGAKVNPNVRR